MIDIAVPTATPMATPIATLCIATPIPAPIATPKGNRYNERLLIMYKDRGLSSQAVKSVYAFLFKFAHKIFAVVERALVHLMLKHFIKMRHITKSAVE